LRFCIAKAMFKCVHALVLYMNFLYYAV